MNLQQNFLYEHDVFAIHVNRNISWNMLLSFKALAVKMNFQMVYFQYHFFLGEQYIVTTQFKYYVK